MNRYLGAMVFSAAKDLIDSDSDEAIGWETDGGAVNESVGKDVRRSSLSMDQADQCPAPVACCPIIVNMCEVLGVADGDAV